MRILTAFEQVAVWQPFEPPEGMHITDYGGDSYGGEYLGSKIAWDKTTGDKMGYLDYGSHPDHGINIKMVEVSPQHRGRGVADALVNAVRHDHDPGTKVNPGMMTDDGGKWWVGYQKRNPL